MSIVTYDTDVSSELQEEYVSPADVIDRGQRQKARYQLRNRLRKVTKIERLRNCGVPDPGRKILVKVKDGNHHYSGLWMCGSGWICPVCGAKIRFNRGNEISKAVVAAIKKGWHVLFITRTLPHSVEDYLGVTLNLLAEGRRYVTNRSAVRNIRKRAGYKGSICGKEVTYGINGWHPHTHDIEFFDKEMTLENFGALADVYYKKLKEFYDKRGFPGLTREHGVKVEDVRLSGNVLAQYIAKLQEGADFRLHTAQEMTRADLKKGRDGSILPFEIINLYFITHDIKWLLLWHEYEQGTSGKSVIRFSQGLRELLLPDEKEETDEEIANKDVGGSEVVSFERWLYKNIMYRNLEGDVLEALDKGGFIALVELLAVYHLDSGGGYAKLEEKEPSPEMTKEEIEEERQWRKRRKRIKKYMGPDNVVRVSERVYAAAPGRDR